MSRGFPGSPVVKTPHFHSRGTGSIPVQGTRIPQTTQKIHLLLVLVQLSPAHDHRTTGPRVSAPPAARPPAEGDWGPEREVLEPVPPPPPTYYPVAGGLLGFYRGCTTLHPTNSALNAQVPFSPVLLTLDIFF